MTNWAYGARSIHQGPTGIRYTYEEIRHLVSKRGACPACGKRRTRSTTFTNTVSPFNVDPGTGQPRTVAQIEEVLAAKADAWSPDFTCQGCRS